MANEIPEGGFLALDWGRRKVGFATGDETGLLVTPRGRFERRDKRETWRLSASDVQTIRKLIATYQPGALILGLPLNADSTESEASAGARALAVQLQAELKLKVVLVPEILTSWASRDAEDEDAAAAALLIQDHLSNIGKGSS